MPLYAIALVWGLCEATLFFIVPDVLLSFIALRRPRQALAAAVLAALGALPGGMLMYAWAAHEPARAVAAVEKVPAIGPRLIDQVRDQLRERGPIAVAIGPYIGWPYKIYAVQAREAGIGPVAFAAITVPARLSRFLLVALIVAGVSRLLKGRIALGWRYGVLAALWVAIYAQYWSSMEW